MTQVHILQGQNQSQQLLGVTPLPRVSFGSQGSLIPRKYEKGFAFTVHHNPAALVPELRALPLGQMSSDTLQPPPKGHQPLTLDPLGMMATYSQDESQGLNLAFSFLWLLESLLYFTKHVYVNKMEALCTCSVFHLPWKSQRFLPAFR